MKKGRVSGAIEYNVFKNGQQRLGLNEIVSLSKAVYNENKKWGT